MTTRQLQTTFTSGEIATQLIGRTDDSGYKSGAYKLENFVVLPQGAIRSRSGFQYVSTAKDSTLPVRLIPFRFASNQTVLLVFGNYTMRLIIEGKEVLNTNGSVYEVSTPFSANELTQLDHCQNGDVITFTSTTHIPVELIRYSALDWRFSNVNLSPKISPPSSVWCSAQYASYLSEEEEKDKNKLSVKYVVTSVTSEGYESIASGIATGTGNYYINGCTIRIAWNGVVNAEYYKVYRYVAGLYGYIGQTTNTYLDDQGDNPDTSETPPKYKGMFNSEGGVIRSITVNNGGSGYKYAYANNVLTMPSSIQLTAIPAVAIWAERTVTNAISDGYTHYDYYVVGNKIWYIYLVVQDNDAQSILDIVELDWGSVNPDSATDVSYNDNANDNSHTAHASGRQGNIYLPYLKNTTTFSTSKYQNKKNVTFYIHIVATVTENADDKMSYNVVNSNGHIYGGGRALGGATTTNGTIIAAASFLSDIALKFLRVSEDNPSGFNASKGITYTEWVNKFGVAANDYAEIPLTISSKTGTGASAYGYATGGVIRSVVMTSGGAGYKDATVSVTDNNGGVGSGASFTAVISQGTTADLPSAVTLFDQRRVFAGSTQNPLKVWLTNAGYQDTMMYHLPVQDDDRIEIAAVASDADRIRHAVALESLLLFTGSAELRVYTQNSDALSPKSVAVRAQSFVGCNDCQPVVLNNLVMFAGNRGGHVYAMGYQNSASSYVSQDISLRASHLFDNHSIKSLALSKSPVQTLWLVTDEGTLLACTIYPDQNIMGWYRIVTDGLFECVETLSEGNEDHLYAVIRRGNTRFIERMSNVTVPESLSTHRYLDCYAEGSFSSATQTVTGLSYLEGRTVAVFADGQAQSNKVVNNGQITLDTPAKNIAVGLPYTCTLETVPLIAQAEGALQGRVKNISELYLRVSYNGDLYANNLNATKLYKIKKDDVYMKPHNAKGYVVKVSTDGSWDYDAQLKVEHRDCAPIEIASVVTNFTVEDGK